MCENHKLTYGIELEGYTSENIRGNHLGGWNFIHDGSLEDGREECDCCGGSGRETVECPECDGSGREDCGHCNGSGSVECHECDGTNDIECGHCNGSGYNDDDSKCEHCEGSGLVECENCNQWGEVECSECEGSGDITCECCSGEGDFERECWDCDGRGFYGDSDGGYGVECVSGICNEGDFSPIDRIFDYISDKNWYVDDSCGTHVHIGTSHLSAQDLSKLAILMNIVEPMIYGSLPYERLDGSYAKMTNKDMVEYFISEGDCISLQEVANKYYGYVVNLARNFQKYEDARYYGLNLHSYFYRGTVEFRYFEGADDKRQAKNWIDLCIKLVDFAKYTTFDQLLVIGKDFHSLGCLDLKLGKLETLLGLDYNIRPYSVSAYDESMENVASYFKRDTEIQQAV